MVYVHGRGAQESISRASRGASLSAAISAHQAAFEGMPSSTPEAQKVWMCIHCTSTQGLGLKSGWDPPQRSQ